MSKQDVAKAYDSHVVQNEDGDLAVKPDKADELQYRRNYLPAWRQLRKLILDHTGKTNQIKAAFEGGYRQQRRADNLNAAFTFGYRFSHADLDNPDLKK